MMWERESKKGFIHENRHASLEWDDDDIGFPFLTCRSFSTNRAVGVPYVPYTNVPGFSHEYSILPTIHESLEDLGEADMGIGERVGEHGNV